MPPSADDGLEKSATLLIALGEDHAAEILKHLGPREVQKIGHAMPALKSVPRARVEAVLDEYHKNADEHSAVHVDTDSYVRSVLTKALGDDKASNLISRILQGGETSGIEGLKWMDASTVADLIKNEHPQIIATILVHLEHDHASEILNHFTERLRNDVVLRVSCLARPASSGRRWAVYVQWQKFSTLSAQPTKLRWSTRFANTTPTWRRKFSMKCPFSRI